MTNDSALRSGLRAILFCYVVALCCPVEYFPVGPEVDASWQYALNLAAAQDLRFGEDIVWPSGPYAHLDSPMAVGDNLAEAFWAQVGLWMFVAAVLGDLFFLQKAPLRGLVTLAAAVAVAAPVFHFNTQGSDILLAVTALILAASALSTQRWRFRLALAAVAAGLAVTLKLSAAVLAGLGVFTAALVLLARDRRQGAEAAVITLCLGPLAGALAYWSHNPSVRGLFQYVVSMRELASGYGVAMSADGPVDELWLALGVAGALFAIGWLLFRGSRDKAGVALIFVAPLLISFKHGFVRQDVHIVSYFSMAVLSMGLMAAYAPRGRVTPHVFALLMAPTLLVGLRASIEARLGWVGGPSFVNSITRSLSGQASLFPLGAVTNFEGARADLMEAGRVAHAEVGRQLPTELRQRIDTEQVAVLSPYFGFAQPDGLNLRLLPTIQKYAAYTPALDRRLAAWIGHGAPDLMLVEWLSIDGRHPLLETPATWMAVWSSFNCIATKDGWALLERRPFQRLMSVNWSSKSTVQTGQEALLPDGADAVTLTPRLSMAGKVKAAAHRISPVLMRISRQDGVEASYRVVPATLASPVLIAPLPLSLEELALVLASDAGELPGLRVRELALVGPGVASYEEITEISYFRLSTESNEEVPITALPRPGEPTP